MTDYILQFLKNGYCIRELNGRYRLIGEKELKVSVYVFNKLKPRLTPKKVLSHTEWWL